MTLILSVAEALRHAGLLFTAQECSIKWIDSETVNDKNARRDPCRLRTEFSYPGGFGNRGIEGMIVNRTVREEQTTFPISGYASVCRLPLLNLQEAFCGLNDANSGEFDPDCKPQGNRLSCPTRATPMDKGGTHPARRVPLPRERQAPKLAECYKAESEINERHRHRYEFNNDYRDDMTAKGLVISGTSPDNHIVETVEIPEKRFLCGRSVPPRIQIPPEQGASAVYGACKGRTDKQTRNS